MSKDPLSDALSSIKNHEDARKSEIRVTPPSNLIKDVLKSMRTEDFIRDFEEDEENRELVVELKGKINNCGVIKPRFSVKQDEFEKWEKRYLPAAGFGVLIVSTSEGIMTHEEAQEQGIGGRLIAYVY